MSCFNPCNSNSAIEQAVDDALADRITDLDGFKQSASKSAEQAAASAVDAHGAADEAKGYRDQAQTVANTASSLVPDILEASNNIKETAETLEAISQTTSSFLVRNYYYTVVGGENSYTFPLSESVSTIQAIYIEGSRQDNGYGFTYDPTTKTITFAETFTESQAGTVLTIQIGQTNVDSPETVLSTLAGPGGAGYIGIQAGGNLQTKLDDLTEAENNQNQSINAVTASVLALQEGLADPDQVSKYPAWQIARWKDEGDVRGWGAVGNGITDDSAAFNAALAAVNNVSIPKGTFVLNKPLTVSGKAVRFRGKGVGISVLKSTLTAGAMLTVRPTIGDHFFDIGDFSCVSTALTTALVDAIVIDGTAQLTTDTYKTMYLTGERERRRGIINNIDFNPTDSTHGFNRGVRFISLLNFKFSDMTFYGPASSYSAEAYAIEGQGVPVDIRAHNLYAYNCKKGLNMPDYVEALYLNEYEFVNVNMGISNVYDSSRSVVPASVTERSNSLKIHAGHINCNGPIAANFKGAAYLQMKDMLIIIGSQPETQKIGVNITDSNYAKISAMQFTSTLGTTTNADAMFCIVGSNVTNAQISENSSNGFNEIVHLSTNSNDNVINDNINRSGGVGIAVVLADATCVSNTLRNNDSDGTKICAYASLQNDVGITDYVSYTTVTLAAGNAGTSQDIAVPIPANIYKSLPDTATLFSANGANNLIGEYIPSSSSATSATFRIHSGAGVAISAGTYNMCFRASKVTG